MHAAWGLGLLNKETFRIHSAGTVPTVWATTSSTVPPFSALRSLYLRTNQLTGKHGLRWESLAGQARSEEGLSECAGSSRVRHQARSMASVFLCLVQVLPPATGEALEPSSPCPFLTLATTPCKEPSPTPGAMTALFPNFQSCERWPQCAAGLCGQAFRSMQPHLPHVALITTATLACRYLNNQRDLAGMSASAASKRPYVAGLHRGPTVAAASVHKSSNPPACSSTHQLQLGLGNASSSSLPSLCLHAGTLPTSWSQNGTYPELWLL